MFRLVGDVEPIKKMVLRLGEGQRRDGIRLAHSRAAIPHDPGLRDRTRRLHVGHSAALEVGRRRCCSAPARFTSRTRRTSTSTSKSCAPASTAYERIAELCSPDENARPFPRKRKANGRSPCSARPAPSARRSFDCSPIIRGSSSRRSPRRSGRRARRTAKRRAGSRARPPPAAIMRSTTCIALRSGRWSRAASSSRRSTPRSPAKSKRRSRRPGKFVLSNAKNFRMEPDVPLVIPR